MAGWAKRLLTIGALALAAAQLGAKPAPAPANVTQARLLAANREPGNWMAPGRTFDEQRYSPLAQINDANVGQLGLAWYVDLPVDRGVEASPLAIDGVLYNIEPWNVTTAYDARNGRELWRFDPQVSRDKGRHACCDIVSRGLAAWKGRIYIGTLDGRLIALDAKTGRQVWSVATLDPVWPYTITGAPRVYDGKVLIGNAGAEGSARGYVTAYDAASGKQLWRFYTVPGNPADGFKDPAMAMAAKTWTGEWWKVGGGGTVWDAMAYDPALGLIYIGTGNGGPWQQADRSPGGGDNLFLSSVIALRADTGAYVWHYQTTPEDEWDFTATQSIILAELPIDGKPRKVLIQAPKNGYFYVIDRATGKLLSAEPYVPMNWNKGIDKATGRPVINPEAHYGVNPVMLTPGPAGGHNWYPMAFSPRTGLAYFAVTEMYQAYSRNPAFKAVPGNMNQTGFGSTGFELTRQAAADYALKNNKFWLTAWDPVAQKERWRVPYPQRGSGGVLATAGNLVFQGTILGTFAAYHAETGAKLWESPVQQVPVAAPISFTVGGEQYVAINAGWGGGLAHSVDPRGLGVQISKARLLVYKLGGTAALPALQAKAGGAYRPPVSGADISTIRRGEGLFADTCAGCHGERAIGGVKDLRRMSEATHAEFLDVVIGGKRKERGMAGFADVISVADAKAIHAYLISRNHEDWASIAEEK